MKRMQRVFGDLDALRYVDGSLDEDRKAGFLAHLAEDAVETERVATWSRQNDMIRAAFAGVATETIPPALRLSNIVPPRLGQAPAAEAAGTAVPLRSLPARGSEDRRADGELAQVAYLKRPRGGDRRMDRLLRLPLSAALLLGLAMLIVYVAHGLLVQPTTWPDDPPPRRFAEPAPTLAVHAADAFATYALDPSRPVEFTAAQDRDFERWVKRRLGIAIEAADLGAEGWSFLGSRLVPASDGPGAFFVYENHTGDRLGLLVTRASPFAPNTPDLTSPNSGLATMTWTVGAFAYSVAVGRSADWLSRNGEALRERIAH